MALTLNLYWWYIDLKTPEGLKVFNRAFHGFESPLAVKPMGYTEVDDKDNN